VSQRSFHRSEGKDSRPSPKRETSHTGCCRSDRNLPLKCQSSHSYVDFSSSSPYPIVVLGVALLQQKEPSTGEILQSFSIQVKNLRPKDAALGMPPQGAPGAMERSRTAHRGTTFQNPLCLLLRQAQDRLFSKGRTLRNPCAPFAVADVFYLPLWKGGWRGIFEADLAAKPIRDRHSQST